MAVLLSLHHAFAEVLSPLEVFSCVTSLNSEVRSLALHLLRLLHNRGELRPQFRWLQ